MNELHITPYFEFEAEQLGEQFHDLVRANQDLLIKRNLLGVLARYGTTEKAAIANIRKGQLDENPQHFAVVDDHDTLVGAASIYQNLGLFRQDLPLPSRIAKRVGDSHEIVTVGPNIHAWTGKIALLGKTYSVLSEHADAQYGWTIEPERSGLVVHSALLAAGFRPHDAARYDDGESVKRAPPKSVLYTLD